MVHDRAYLQNLTRHSTIKGAQSWGKPKRDERNLRQSLVSTASCRRAKVMLVQRSLASDPELILDSWKLHNHYSSSWEKLHKLRFS